MQTSFDNNLKGKMETKRKKTRGKERISNRKNSSKGKKEKEASNFLRCFYCCYNKSQEIEEPYEPSESSASDQLNQLDIIYDESITAIELAKCDDKTEDENLEICCSDLIEEIDVFDLTKESAPHRGIFHDSENSASNVDHFQQKMDYKDDEFHLSKPTVDENDNSFCFSNEEQSGSMEEINVVKEIVEANQPNKELVACDEVQKYEPNPDASNELDTYSFMPYYILALLKEYFENCSNWGVEVDNSSTIFVIHFNFSNDKKVSFLIMGNWLRTATRCFSTEPSHHYCTGSLYNQPDKLPFESLSYSKQCKYELKGEFADVNRKKICLSKNCYENLLQSEKVIWESKELTWLQYSKKYLGGSFIVDFTQIESEELGISAFNRPGIHHDTTISLHPTADAEAQRVNSTLGTFGTFATSCRNTRIPLLKTESAANKFLDINFALMLTNNMSFEVANMTLSKNSKGLEGCLRCLLKVPPQNEENKGVLLRLNGLENSDQGENTDRRDNVKRTEEKMESSNENKNVTTKLGFTIMDSLTQGKDDAVSNKEDCLFLATDPRGFEVFKYKYRSAIKNHHPSFDGRLMYPVNTTDLLKRLRETSLERLNCWWIVESSVSIYRSIEGFAFTSVMTSDNRNEIIQIMERVACSLEYQFVSATTKISKDKELLQKYKSLLFKPKSYALQEWPNGRGVILPRDFNKNRQTVVKVNHDEHLEIRCQTRGGAVKHTLVEALKTEALIKDALKDKGLSFYHHAEFGYLNANLDYLGLAIAIRIQMHTPLFHEHIFFEEFIKHYNLRETYYGRKKNCSFKVLELECTLQFGTSEVENLNKVYEASEIMIEMERCLEDQKDFVWILPDDLKKKYSEICGTTTGDTQGEAELDSVMQNDSDFNIEERQNDCTVSRIVCTQQDAPEKGATKRDDSDLVHMLDSNARRQYDRQYEIKVKPQKYKEHRGNAQSRNNTNRRSWHRTRHGYLNHSQQGFEDATNRGEEDLVYMLDSSARRQYDRLYKDKFQPQLSYQRFGDHTVNAQSRNNTNRRSWHRKRRGYLNHSQQEYGGQHGADNLPYSWQDRYGNDSLPQEPVTANPRSYCLNGTTYYFPSDLKAQYNFQPGIYTIPPPSQIAYGNNVAYALSPRDRSNGVETVPLFQVYPQGQQVFQLGAYNH